LKKKSIFLSVIKGIIFDFDGVIVDSIHVKSEAFAKLYASYGNKIVKKVINHHEANGGISRYDKIKFYHNNFLKKDISSEEVLLLANSFSNEVFERVVNSSYVEGVLDYIQKSYKNYKLFISTGTPINEITKILKIKKLTKYFIDIYGSPDNKETHIQNIIDKYKLTPQELIFIGDSQTDFDAAKKFNIRFIYRLHNNNLLLNNCDCEIIKNFIGLTI